MLILINEQTMGVVWVVDVVCLLTLLSTYCSHSTIIRMNEYDHLDNLLAGCLVSMSGGGRSPGWDNCISLVPLTDN